MSDEGTRALLDLGTLLLGELRGLREDMRNGRPAASVGGGGQRASGGTGGAHGVCFPNYGRSNGQPIAGATMGDLEYYAAGCRRSLGNPEKARFHGKERETLAAIEAEIARQEGGGQGPSDGGSGVQDFGGPPPDDDMIPFAWCGGVR